jgi:hypothetical protein
MQYTTLRTYPTSAEIPDEVAGSRLTVKQSGQGFDAVSIDQQHGRKLIRFSDADKTLK